MKNLSKTICAAMVTGLLAVGTVSTVYAAENSEGVAKFIEKSTDSITKGLEELNGGRPEEAIKELKNFRQESKEITGAAASIQLQKVNQAVKETLRILEEEKDNKKAIENLTPAVASMKDIAAKSKAR